MPALALILTLLLATAGALTESRWSPVCAEDATTNGGAPCGQMLALGVPLFHDGFHFEHPMPGSSHNSSLDIIPTSISILICASTVPGCGHAVSRGDVSIHFDLLRETSTVEEVFPVFLYDDWRPRVNSGVGEVHVDRIIMAHLAASAKVVDDEETDERMLTLHLDDTTDLYVEAAEMLGALEKIYPSVLFMSAGILVGY